MNKLVKVVVGFVAVIAVSKTIQSVMVGDEKSQLKKGLVKVVNDTNAMLPKKLDENLELTKVELIGERTLRYHYTLANMGSSAQEKSILEQNTIKNACNGPTKDFLKLNVSVEFKYTGGGNDLLVSVPPSRRSYHVGVKSAIFAASSQRKTKKTLKPTCYDFLLLANTR